jgi:A20-like zinc finger
MEGTGSGQREMQSPPVSAPCRRPGCVFYAHHLFDGMCSKCFKDLKEQMQASSRTSSVNTATTSSNNNSSSDSQFCYLDSTFVYCSSHSRVEMYLCDHIHLYVEFSPITSGFSATFSLHLRPVNIRCLYMQI